MDFLGVAIICMVVLFGLQRCQKEDNDHQIELKKIEFRIDSLKNSK